jgi:hypothetical protein
MKIRFAKGAFTLGRPRRQREELLSPAQAARVKALVQSLTKQSKPQPPAPERHMVRSPATFSVTPEVALREAAEQLGVQLSRLNEGQKRLLIAMGNRPMTREQRLQMLEDAA